ncbi:MAG: tRNA epoxyqueuosine(34) reductase QueG [Candidatus Eisenbacteria bacterium]|nr:tRNA epoxyqueuosine(34) reductase QueG [Candidatus Eisenbacteria bacterium]
MPNPTARRADPPRDASPGERLKARALALGFDAAGIARVEPLEAIGRYEAWLAAGRHGDMAWLANDKHRSRRADPARLLAGIRSVLCVALAYPPAREEALDARVGRIARYAAGEDYHALMKEKLGALEDWIRAELLPGSGSLWYSDTGAILERGWAERAGLGWIGKHSGLLSPARGSYFLLGEVLMDRDLEPDAPLAGEHCGTCTRCLDQCPTNAIVAPYQVDARLCISYLTIELRGPIPRELRPLVGDWIFGCDVCQEVCPWNRFAPPAREARLHARELEGWTLERFLALDEPGFRELFATSPIRRADREGFLRNVCVALGNRGQAAALTALARSLAHDPSPLVRGHAAWAIGRIAAAAGLATADGPAAGFDRARHDRTDNGPAGGDAGNGSRTVDAGGAIHERANAVLRAAEHDDSTFVREEATLALAGVRA